MTETPARYRHRTPEVDAVQWTGSNAEELRAFAGADFDEIELDDRVEDPDQTAAVRESEHGTWRGLKPGDWVVKRGVDLHEVSAADFAKRYEAADRAGLRDRIAAAIWERQNPGRRYADCEYRWRADAEADADAVLAVLPASGGRGAVLRDFLWRLEQSSGYSAAEKLLDDNPDLAELRRVADETPQPETREVEDPARIDRLRPEFFEHASVEAIDSQIRRAQTQQRQWGNRARTLAILREARVKQKELGEWPAVGAQQPKEAESPRTVCVCGHTRAEHLVVGGRLLCDACDGLDADACKEFEAL